MRMWFDTEFMEDGKTIELLSIGIVREDDEKYYAVNKEADLSRANDWVKENVLPKLDNFGGQEKTRALIRAEVEAFVRADGSKPEIWGYFADYDWVAFCQLFGRMIDLPKDFPKYCRDIKQLCMELGNPQLPMTIPGTEHNALADALWNRSAWTFCAARRHRQAELLREWLDTPFFETKDRWADWVKDFRPRVQKSLE